MVSIIILNYNTFQLTCNCIGSVLEFTTTAYEIIVVDNASTECSADKFKELFPSIVVVKSNTNTGFAGGNNLGIAHAKGDIILLLNSDAYLQEDAISKCAAKIHENSNMGVVGCKMIYPDGRLQHTARKFRSIQWELLDIFRFILYLLPYKKRATMMLGRYFRSDFDTECDWLNGAFFMFRKAVLEQLPNNRLDDRFFMYGEDHLWCMQIRKLGYQHYFLSTAEIVHINSGSTEPQKHLQLKRVMMKHEVEILNSSGKSTINLFFLKLIFVSKETIRYLVKYAVQKVTGKLIPLF